MRTYDLLWLPAIAILRRHPRLAPGFEQRTAKDLPGPADVWIHSASAGEAYLAVELAKAICAERPFHVLLTTNTRQGMQILRALRGGDVPTPKGLNLQTAYFPFDRPGVMRQVAASANPRVTVLIETEIWPGHLLALKETGSRILLVNGRLTSRSLKRYRLWPGLWAQLCPDEILAVSRPDAERFRILFDASAVAVMPNMKFDRMTSSTATNSAGPGLAISPDRPFVVMGSIRRKEERLAARMIAELLGRLPQAVIGLFPRHMERLKPWQKRLTRQGFAWQLRALVDRPPPAGSIVLWDRFGELGSAYARADAAFVGGSLSPLGGHNFLEPLAAGIPPVIGPHWDNFHWVGIEIASCGLLQVAGNWQQAAALLARTVALCPDRAGIRAAAGEYMRTRWGGTRLAAERVRKHLEFLERLDR